MDRITPSFAIGATRNRFTLPGLLIAYLSIAGSSLFFRQLAGGPLTDWQLLGREALIFLLAALLVRLVRLEGLSLTSVGLYPEKIGRSLLWAGIAIVLSFGLLLVCLGVFQQLGWTFGQSGPADKRSLWLTSVVVLRAGTVEELFFRGYIIERLQLLSGNRYVAGFGSLLPFALFHYSQGWAGIIVALVLGGVLTAMYLWRQDLKSAMFAHFILDFVPNVVGAL